ncbi:MAG TPA: gas vesicle protein GvpG [Flexivirga sp.]|uniref:gas vesicle protein GvpG n=1 Tax=Flexivirga sp. TaxID=1962927 RepID=UPI002BBC29BE|nr:gas vesicle protein GvpG [Flexivirga sp.]HWC21742.1 gas vesicle protein GvpG [Flexivirga sp.]
MGLVSSVLGLPLAPVRLSVAIAEQVRRQAEEMFYDPASIRAQLQDVARQRSDGTLSDEEATAREDELVDRLMTGSARGSGV